MKTMHVLTLATFFLIGITATAQVDKTKQTQKFHLIDADGNEVITIRELIAFYKGKTTKSGEPIDAKVIFHGLNTNKNSIITLDEFIKGVNWEEGKKLREAEIEKRTSTYNESLPNQNINATKKENRFRKIDKNSNGNISLKEMISFYNGKKNSSGEPVKAKLMFYGLDSDENDKLTLDEFIQKADWQAARLRMNKVEPNEISSEDVANIKEDKFKKIDSNADSVLSFDEVFNYNKIKANKTGKLNNGAIIFYGLDSNGDDEVSLAEFSKKINWKLGKKKLKAIEESKNSYDVPTVTDNYVMDQIDKFTDVDVDKNYKLTLNELLNYYKGKTNADGKQINGEVMYYGLDKDNNGTINLEEFTLEVNFEKVNEKMKNKNN